MGAVTDGAIASFADAVDAKAMSQAAVDAKATEAIQSSAKPGLIGRGLSIAAGIVGGPLAGLAVDTVARGYNASKAAQAHNDTFGTNVDTSTLGNVGSQAVGAVGGLVGGRSLGHIGGRLGAGLGVPGAIAGSVAGQALGSNLGRGMAMGAMNGQPGSASSTGPGGVPGSPAGGGLDTGQGATMVASAPTTTTPSGNTRPDFGPVDFNGYASYAQSFFA